MADVVIQEGIGYKRRNPWGVFGLTVVTLGIYGLVWWYKINNELRNYGITNDPAMATLAISLGSIVIVPPFVTVYNTADRIRQAQEASNARERIIPVLALVLMIIVGVFAEPYIQSQINKVWDALAEEGAAVMPA